MIERPHSTARIVRRMRIDAERVFYCGDLGQPAMRRIGALVVQVSLDAPVRYRFDGADWQEADCVVVQPYVRHQLWCATRLVCNLLIEPETVDPAGLPGFLRSGHGAVQAPAFVQRMRAAAGGAPLPEAALDMAFFDGPLPRRPLDRRIASALHSLQQAPELPDDAQALAAQAGLSISRFLHVFKQQTGCSYRALRAWKRARLLLPSINQVHNLARLAQDFGYPDSSHFSHSIRGYYGITPSNILRGCRRIQIVDQVAAAAALPA